MTYAGDSSIDARVRDVNADFGRRQTRLFVRFASVEGAILLILVALIYGFQVIDPQIGIWFILAFALIGGVLLSMLLVRLVQARTRALAQAKGENPLF